MNLNTLLQYPQRIFLIIAVASAAMFGFGLYLQEVVGLVPCPMCIVQRYCLIVVFIIAGLAAWAKSSAWQTTGYSLLMLIGGFGAFVAARQSWLQWYPPEIVMCGRDLYGMIENLPIKRVLPMVFAGSGDCTKVDWTFLSLSIANWSFLFFTALAIGMLLIIVKRMSSRA